MKRAHLILCASLAIASLGAQGCYRTAQLDVVRPASLNAAPYGNNFEVLPVEGDPSAGERIRQALRQRITESLNRAITLSETGGAIAIQAAIRRLELNVNDERANGTCSHTERVNGRDVNRSHTCTNITRIGTLSAQVELRVFVTNNQQVIFTRTYDATQVTRVRGREGPYRADFIALGNIDPIPLRDAALDEIVERFARVILPWRDTVELNFEGCDGDARCTQAYDRVQQRDLQGAEQLVTQVIGADGAPVPEQQRVRVGEAYYNRAMVRLIRGLYGGAYLDLQHAIQLLPDREGYRTRYQQLEQLARDQDAMRQQQGIDETPGAGSNGTNGATGAAGTTQPVIAPSM